MPGNQIAGWFRNNEGSTFLKQLGCSRAKHVTEPESGKPEFRLTGRPKWSAGQPGSLFLSGAGGRTTNLLPVNQQRKAAIMFLQHEMTAIRKVGFGQGGAWFHARNG